MAETKSKPPGAPATGSRVSRFFGGVRDVGLDHAREAWADIGNVYQNVLWSHSGIGAPNQPQPQLGPAAVQSLTMSVEVEMQFGPGLKEPHVTVRKGATVHETRTGPPQAAPARDGGKAGPAKPAAPETGGPDSTINKVGPPAAASAPSASSKAGTVGPPKSVEPPAIKPDTPAQEYHGPEIGL